MSIRPTSQEPFQASQQLLNPWTSSPTTQSLETSLLLPTREQHQERSHWLPSTEQTPERDPLDLVNSTLGLLRRHVWAFAQPYRDAVSYVESIFTDPALNTNICEQAGKVIHITARFFNEPVRPVALRGNIPPLSWREDRHGDRQQPESISHEKTFTFSIDPEEINKVLEFKFCTQDTEGNPKWSDGYNLTFPLQGRGHFVKIGPVDVSFS